MSLDMGVTSLSRGQEEARWRWGTQETGAAFDRKKHPFLTDEARKFILQQAMCVASGPGLRREPCGLLLTGRPGFIALPDRSTCVLPIAQRYEHTSLCRGIQRAMASGYKPQLALCFLQHVTRRRLCVQGVVEYISEPFSEVLWLSLRVRQAFFHCPRYIRTRVPGLHMPRERSALDLQRVGLAGNRLTSADQAFLARQTLCYLCTVDRYGQYAVNHRGGAAGFLLALPPDRLTPGGLILLPDYAGNGAFEAIGNILETEQAALLVPDYAEQAALYISGQSSILEPEQLPMLLRESCRGIQRIVALAVRHVEVHRGDWSSALAHERTLMLAHPEPGVPSCPD